MPFNLFGSDKKTTTTTVTSTDTDIHQEVGVSEGGIGVGAGGQANSNAISPSISESEDIFAPVFSFNNQRGSGSNRYGSSVMDYFNSEPAFGQEYARVKAAGDRRTPEQWMQDHLAASPDDQAKFAAFGQPPPPSSVSDSAGIIQANATQVKGDNSVGSGGDISAPIASGDDAIAIQSSGPVAVGDNAPAISANASGGGVTAPLTAGEDLTNNAPVIVGNSGTVSIQTADPAVAQAAIDAAGEALKTSTSFADRALTAIGEANKDPEERVTNNALIAVVGVVALLGGFFLFGKGKTA